MVGRLVYLVLCVAVLVGWVPSPSYAGDPTLVGCWKLDEGSGTTAYDLSDYANDGTLANGPQWTAGMLDGALQFDGSDDSVEVPHNASLSITDAVTIAAWIYMAPDASGEMAVLSKGSWGANNLPYELTVERGAVIFWQFYDSEGRDMCAPESPSADEWHHLTATYDGAIFKCYIDGVFAEEAAYVGTMPENSSDVTIGRRSGGGCFFNGMIDEVVLLNRALDESELPKVMNGWADPALASDPVPADEATDVSRDTLLNWTAGDSAATHDVYLGTTFDDVNDASRTDAKDVLVSQDQDAATYDPGRLEFGQTYYWRVDEVNAAPDNTIFKGQTWSFTTEPLAYPIAGIVATSNAPSGDDAGPENLVNGSGLDELNQHGTTASTMWLCEASGLDSVWLQFDFDGVYKLHEMMVWNYNAEFEMILGFGLKNVTVEYSSDGVEWTSLGDAELAQATAAPGYMANTTVDMQGVAARSVRLTVNSIYGALTQYGLSEVRFLYVPVQAREPEPADGATAVDVATALSWRAGREAASHEVSLSTDADAVATGAAVLGTVTVNAYTPDDLAFGTTYYWKVTEVNEAEAMASWDSAVWSFTAQEYGAIDDFEAYDDDQNRIYDTWLDGWVNETGSIVGYGQEPFAETSIVHGGRQAMPLEYINDAAPYYSEAERELGGADLTAGGADMMRVYVYGSADNDADTFYVAVEDTSGSVAVASYPDAAVVTTEAWQEWVIPLADLGGVNLVAVQTIYVGVGDRDNPSAGGAGLIYVDDIQFGNPAGD